MYDFFETIDTEEKAYFLGLLITDGGIFLNKSKKNAQLVISLLMHEEALSLLQRFKILTNATQKITFLRRSVGTYCRLDITSNKMAGDLNNLGMIGKKPDRFFTILRRDLMSHYVRGIFDGDGCISLSTSYYKDKHYSYPRVTFSHASCNFLVGLSNYLNSINIVTENVRPKKPKGCTLSTGRSRSIKLFYNFLYNNNSICLERKKLKFETILSKR